MSQDGTTAICPRTEAGAVKRCGEAGWLHQLGGRATELRRNRCHTLPLTENTEGTADFRIHARRFIRQMDSNRLAHLATELNVSVESLRRLSVGWDGRAWTFPMCDDKGRIIGIRRRFPDGFKCAVRGSRNGLFLPRGLSATGALCVAEGETDCAALLTLGFDAIGRSSSAAGAKLLIRLARGRETVIVADNDEPGRRGAGRLAQALACRCPSVRIVAPPARIKDSRAWLRAGATHDDIQAAIDAVAPLRVRVRVRSTRSAWRGMDR